MSKIHIPTPIITTYSKPVYTSDRLADLAKEREEREAYNEGAERDARDQAMRELGEVKFNQDSIYKNMDGDHLSRGEVYMARLLPDDLKPWVKCGHCGYEKRIFQPCDLPCV